LIAFAEEERASAVEAFANYIRRASIAVAAFAAAPVSQCLTGPSSPFRDEAKQLQTGNSIALHWLGALKRRSAMEGGPKPRGANLSRRNFITASASAAATPLMFPKYATAEKSETAPMGDEPQAKIPTSLTVNKQPYRLALDPRTSLLDALRDEIGLTGTKKGCDHGQCGACTVLVNGVRVLSCMSFAVMNDGRDVTTIEGLESPSGELHPMQQAFIDHDAFQCGYCTSGQIMSAIGCVNEGHAENDADIREYMSGNLCRCAAYPNIVAAIRQARDATRKV
jgi:xanthine dehydrogenase YagT iron-sulfur-binding subunit